MKKVIKMNSGDKYLSLGNLFYYIKKCSNNKYDVLQSDIFCSIFTINYINNTTVNNYITGIRAVGMEYKKILSDLKNKYNRDNLVFISIILSLISLLDNYVYIKQTDSLEVINNNVNFKKVCDYLMSLTKEDNNINSIIKSKIKKYYESNNLYDFFINVLFYAVLENKQPIFEENINFEMNVYLEDYLKIKLFEGVSYITHMSELAKLGNIYANIEMGSLEFNGFVNGIKNYDNSYKYYINATKENNPKAFYMVAYLIINKKVKGNINFAWKYLNLAIESGSIAAINTMGLCYMNGNNPDNKIDIIKALKLFEKASDYGYSFAFNNLGKYYENKDFNKSLSFYKCSADLNNSWALNKVGEYYRNKNELNTAFFYYKESSLCPISEICYYSFYNLAKYYYLNGCPELNIKSDLNIVKKYLLIASENGVDIADDELKKLELS